MHSIATQQYNIGHICTRLQCEKGKSDQVAMIWLAPDLTRTEYTFKELDRKSNQVANGLLQLGFGKGDKIIIFTPKLPEQIITFLGILKIQAIACILFPTFGYDALLDRIGDAQADCIITSQSLLRRILEIRPQVPSIKTILLVDLRNLASSGGTLADYTFWAPSVITRYAPSIVVIQISNQDFSGLKGGEGYVVSNEGNYFTKNPDGTLKLVHKTVDENLGLLRRIRGEFAFLGFGSDRFNTFLRAYNKTQDPNGPDSSTIDLPLDQQLANYHAQLTALHAAFQGQRVIILVLPDSPTILDGQIALEDKDYSLLLDQVKQFKDWQTVEPLPDFQALWLQDHKLPSGFNNTMPGLGHLNADGHAIVGQLLADKIEEIVK
jgi:lysophospholipase L1-like esterase